MQVFYSGAYTSRGFVDFNSSKGQRDCYNYILKGYPGSLKQSVFLSVKERLDNLGEDYAVLLGKFGQVSQLRCEQRGFLISDGTYPYRHEPETYGVSDKIIDLSEYQDTSALRSGRESALKAAERIKNNELRAHRFLSAAAGVNEDCKRVQRESLDIKKINRYTARTWAKSGGKLTGYIGRDIKIFTDIITDTGVQSDTDLFENMCDEILVISDNAGAAAEMITDRLRRYAMSCGMDVISCMSFLNPFGVPEHVIIPDIRFGVYSQRGKVLIKGTKRIRASRFLSDEMSELAKNRISFSLKALGGLIDEAAQSLEKIREGEKMLDKFYFEATDECRLRDGILSMISELN